MQQYCGGPVMMIDWGDRWLLRRVFGYFRPYWRRGAIALACILGQSVLGLASAIVFKTLINYLAKPSASFGHVAVVVAAGFVAAIAGGLLGVAESYLTETISQGIVYDLREQMFSSLLRQSVGFFTHSRVAAARRRSRAWFPASMTRSRGR